MAHRPDPTTIDDLATPALVVESSVFDANCSAMDAALPGRSLRPHVKAFKSTALAARLAADGHTGFCAATPREIEGMAAAGLGDDLLLANESLDVARLGALADRRTITVAVDSDATLDAAVAGGVRSVLIDVEVGLPRCGATPATPAARRPRPRRRARGARRDGLRGPPDDGRGPAERIERVGAAMESCSARPTRRRRHRLGRRHRHVRHQHVVHRDPGRQLPLLDTHYDGSTSRSRSHSTCWRPSSRSARRGGSSPTPG